MAFYNPTDSIGVILVGFTQNITGSEFLTLFYIMLLFFAIGTLFRLPLFIEVPLILPIIIVSASYLDAFIPMLAVFIIYGAITIAKRLISAS